MKKKIIFWIDGNLSTFCIPKKIQEDIDCEMHAIFNVTNKPKKFIQNQKLIDFKSFSFYHDNVTDLNSEPDISTRMFSQIHLSLIAAQSVDAPFGQVQEMGI